MTYPWMLEVPSYRVEDMFKLLAKSANDLKLLPKSFKLRPSINTLTDVGCRRTTLLSFFPPPSPSQVRPPLPAFEARGPPARYTHTRSTHAIRAPCTLSFPWPALASRSYCHALISFFSYVPPLKCPYAPKYPPFVHSPPTVPVRASLAATSPINICCRLTSNIKTVSKPSTTPSILQVSSGCLVTLCFAALCDTWPFGSSSQSTSLAVVLQTTRLQTTRFAGLFLLGRQPIYLLACALSV
jgi:hypothetical protein